MRRTHHHHRVAALHLLTDVYQAMTGCRAKIPLHYAPRALTCAAHYSTLCAHTPSAHRTHTAAQRGVRRAAASMAYMCWSGGALANMRHQTHHECRFYRDNHRHRCARGTQDTRQACACGLSRGPHYLFDALERRAATASKISAACFMRRVINGGSKPAQYLTRALFAFTAIITLPRSLISATLAPPLFLLYAAAAYA